MNKEAREFDLINLNDYKSYYQDTTKEEIINDTYLDYCAYRNTLTQLDIANNKLKEVKEHCENQVNDYNNYADRRCVDERDYGIYLNSQKILSIIGSD